MELKEQILKDNDIFLNFSEFAEEITINSQVYFAVLDDSFDSLDSNSLQGLANAASLGLVQADKIIYIAEKNCTFIPNQRLIINSESFIIDGIKADFGILCITLNRVFA